MDSVSPVWTEVEVESEKVIALDQPEYVPLIIMPVLFSDGTQAMSVRFRFSDEERAKIAAGADLVLTELTFGNPFTPLHIELCQPNERPYK